MNTIQIPISEQIEAINLVLDSQKDVVRMVADDREASELAVRDLNRQFAIRETLKASMECTSARENHQVQIARVRSANGSGSKPDIDLVEGTLTTTVGVISVLWGAIDEISKLKGVSHAAAQHIADQALETAGKMIDGSAPAQPVRRRFKHHHAQSV